MNSPHDEHGIYNEREDALGGIKAMAIGVSAFILVAAVVAGYTFIHYYK